MYAFSPTYIDTLTTNTNHIHQILDIHIRERTEIHGISFFIVLAPLRFDLHVENGIVCARFYWESAYVCVYVCRSIWVCISICWFVSVALLFMLPFNSLFEHRLFLLNAPFIFALLLSTTFLFFVPPRILSVSLSLSLDRLSVRSSNETYHSVYHCVYHFVLDW